MSNKSAQPIVELRTVPFINNQPVKFTPDNLRQIGAEAIKSAIRATRVPYHEIAAKIGVDKSVISVGINVLPGGSNENMYQGLCDFLNDHSHDGTSVPEEQVAA